MALPYAVLRLGHRAFLQPLNKDDKRELREVIDTMNKAIAAIESGAKS